MRHLRGHAAVMDWLILIFALIVGFTAGAGLTLALLWKD